MPARDSQITKYHWIMLLFACLLMFGNYYCYDIPGSINTQLKSWLNSADRAFAWQLNLLYSVYSLPNIVLPLIGGILVDKLGPTRMLMFFSTLIIIGQVLFSVGLNAKDFYWMLIGRFIFGLGGESLEVAQASITTDWFQSKGLLAFALGLNISFARISTALNDNISPLISTYFSVPVSAWVGVIACAVSVGSSMIVINLNQSKYRLKAGVDSISDCIDEAIIKDESSTEPLFERSIDDDTGYDSEEYEQVDNSMHWSIISGFSLSFWLLFVNTITLYGSVQPFFHVCSDFFQEKWYKNDPSYAGFVMSIPDIVSAIGTPICGLMVDKYGHRSLLMIISGFSIMLSLSLMIFTTLSPIIGMTILGFAYSIFASALWPCVPYLVSRHQLATAYGLLSVALNLTLFSAPLVVANLRGKYPDNWYYTFYFFLGVSTVSIIVSIALHLLDIKLGGKLNRGSKKRRSAFAEETQNLIGEIADIDESEDEASEEIMSARVICEGITIPVAQTIIHHHHIIKLTNSGSDHMENCKCFDHQDKYSSSFSKVSKKGSLSPNKISPIRRRHTINGSDSQS